MAGVLILSSAALSDRMLAHTSLLPVLKQELPVRVWATSRANPRYDSLWASVPATVEPFPSLVPYKAFPLTAMRRLNDFAWDFHIQDPSRLSMMRHIRDKTQPWFVRILKNPGRLVAALGLHERLENRLERMMIDFDRSPAALERLASDRPDMVVSTGPLRNEEPAVVGAAKKLGIPVLAFITSWDNLSIKHRMVFKYDGYLVWSERMKQELLERYPHSASAPVCIVGAPQFDVFFRSHLHLSREEFCAREGLRPDLPIIVQAMGVANGVEEHHGALDLARRLARGELGEAQLIVRPHPFNNHLELREMFRPFAPRVVVQQNTDASQERHLRSQDHDEVLRWVNTFRHAEVVVHLSSTVAVDAAIFDRPSVCMDYDPAPGQPRQEIVREVNHLWTHYKPVAESGGMWLAPNPEGVVEGIRAYLRNPGLHREARGKMAEFVCGHLDGRCGERMAEAVLQMMNRVPAAHAVALR
jgi:hypothetical protein